MASVTPELGGAQWRHLVWLETFYQNRNFTLGIILNIILISGFRWFVVQTKIILYHQKTDFSWKIQNFLNDITSIQLLIKHQLS